MLFLLLLFLLVLLVTLAFLFLSISFFFIGTVLFLVIVLLVTFFLYFTCNAVFLRSLANDASATAGLSLGSNLTFGSLSPAFSWGLGRCPPRASLTSTLLVSPYSFKTSCRCRCAPDLRVASATASPSCL